jgi:hypothetical protein
MPDIWNGKRLPERRPIHEEIHYRLYDAHTGKLLSFNSTNSFDGIVTDILRTQQEYPTARIIGRQVDGPAYR